MSIYLHDIPLEEAKKRFDSALEDAGKLGVLGIEEVKLSQKVSGRILAEPIWAKISSPHYHASAMDGFAVRSVDTEQALITAPITLVYESQTTYLDTGDPLPSWADAVIPIENVESVNPSGNPAENSRHPYAIRIRSAVTPWYHVRVVGEDIVASQLILPSGHLLRPFDLGAIAASGIERIRVTRKPKVAVIPTGTELVEVGQSVEPGEIIEFNSLILSAQINEWGGKATRYSIVPDDKNLIKERVSEVVQNNDLVMLIAGSSAGSEDFSAQVIDSLGQVLVHGVAVRPGHPVILGMIEIHGSEKPIIGVPGYPVSAALTGEIFVKPLIERWLGTIESTPVTINATLTKKVTSPAGDDDYMRVVVGSVGKRTLAAPLSKGAGIITSLVQADGIVIIPRGSQGLLSGTEVNVKLLRSTNEINKTIFAMGSHDLILDLLAQYLTEHNRRFVSTNTGSLGGIVALKRQEAHLAGSHLLDTESGEYNIAFIQKYIPDTPVMLIALVGREQGLIMQKENPKNIRGIEDLVRDDVIYINRQHGAGTRVLLDYHLGSISIAPDAIQGYNQEEYTHLGVAAAVQSGRADCGLGITAAAYALDLYFIPLFKERYDLVIPIKYYDSTLLAPIFNILQSNKFRHSVSTLPGYDTSQMGNLIAKLE
jgi:putative molybdopterin biosynthesis protein